MLIGTHNSGTYRVNLKKRLKYNQNQKAYWILSRVQTWFRSIISGFVQCQTHNLYDQYKLGVRMFDLRIGRTEDGGFVISHGFPCIELEEALLFFSRMEEPVYLWIKADFVCSEEVDRFMPSIIRRFEEVADVTINPKSTVWMNTDDPKLLLERLKYVSPGSVVGMHLTPQSLCSKSVKALDSLVDKELCVKVLKEKNVFGYFVDFFLY